MRLPLIVTGNLYRTVAELSQLIVQILDTLCFEPPNEPKMNIVQCLLWTLYDVHLGLIGKRAVDFLLVIIELFSLGVTAEVLQAKIYRKSAISLQRGHFNPTFQVEVDVPHQ